MEGFEEDIDLETAQAQLDRAMAFTDSLVSGWMKASKAKLPSAASRGNNEFDLDEYMRRPPRLGLGASVPPSSSIHSHEASKLRGKLIGNGKKRAREDEDSTPGPSAIVISDDDEESRARVITKKTRLDPFAPKPKKAKADPPKSQPISPPAKATTLQSKPKPANKISDVEEIPRPDGLSSSTPKKRKKKKKHKPNEGAEPHTPLEANASPPHPLSPLHLPSKSHPTSPSQGNGVSVALEPASSEVKQREVIIIKDTPPPEAPQHQSLLGAALSTARSFFSKAMSSQSSIAIPTSASAQTPPVRLQPPKPVPPPSPQHLDPFGNPLLNLDGPPPDVRDEAAGLAKKKRKRRKKKKKHAMVDAAVGLEVIDVDADDDMDED